MYKIFETVDNKFLLMNLNDNEDIIDNFETKKDIFSYFENLVDSNKYESFKIIKDNTYNIYV